MHIMDNIDPVIIDLDDSNSNNEEPVEGPVKYVEIECEEESKTIWIKTMIKKKYIYTAPFGVGG